LDIQLNHELEKMFNQIFKMPEMTGTPADQMNILVAAHPKERTHIKKSELEYSNRV